MIAIYQTFKFGELTVRRICF